MPREVKMPKLSDTMEEGTLNVWRKQEGEAIAKGDILLEIETDKADMEFEAYMSGQLARILVPAGETVAVGTPIAIVRLEADSDEDVERFLSEHGQAAPAAASAPPPSAPSEPSAPAPAAAASQAAPTPAPEAPAPTAPRTATPLASVVPTSSIPFFMPDPDRVRATPRARGLAQERNVDLSEIAGSGPDGAVLVSDVERYEEALRSDDTPLMEGDVHATPVAVRIAEEMGIDLSRVKGTGPSGRVTKRDLRSHVERQAKEGTSGSDSSLYGEEIKLSQKRKFLIRNMVESKQTTPHFYISMDIDAGPMRALRAARKEQGQRVTFTHLILKASALALERFPEVNATFREDRIVRFNPVNVAIAVDVQGELLAPVVKNCHGRALEDLAEISDALIEKARERKLSPEDYADGTFTISNLGMFGVDQFYAIITPPMSTVLSVGSLRTVPVPADDGARFEPGLRMNFGLAVDHRVIDGVRAAQFLAEIRRLLEQPSELVEAQEQGGD